MSSNVVQNDVNVSRLQAIAGADWKTTILYNDGQVGKKRWGGHTLKPAVQWLTAPLCCISSRIYAPAKFEDAAKSIEAMLKKAVETMAPQEFAPLADNVFANMENLRAHINAKRKAITVPFAVGSMIEIVSVRKSLAPLEVPAPKLQEQADSSSSLTSSSSSSSSTATLSSSSSSLTDETQLVINGDSSKLVVTEKTRVEETDKKADSNAAAAPSPITATTIVKEEIVVKKEEVEVTKQVPGQDFAASAATASTRSETPTIEPEKTSPGRRKIPLNAVIEDLTRS